MLTNTQNDSNMKLTITSLLSAVRNNSIHLIRNSLNQYGLPRSGPKTTDYFVLETAIRSEKTEIAKLLINAGCRVKRNEDENHKGHTLLALAVQKENVEVAKLLLQKGADLNIDDSSGLTVLHLAAKKRSVKMLNLLLDHQVDINDASNGKTAFQVFLDSYSSHENQNANIVRLFLDKGATINFKTSGGKTVLHHVVKMNDNIIENYIIHDIIKDVIQITNDINEQDNNKNTALHYWLSGKYCNDEDIIEIVKLFISKGAKIDIPDNNGNTACHLAAKRKYLRVWQIFLECQWDVNCCNWKGDTVLHCILINSEHLRYNHQYFQIVHQILKQNSTKLLKNNIGKSPLHLAAEFKQDRIINIMLPKLIDINDVDMYGTTALHGLMKKLAVENKIPGYDDIEIVKKMISTGANAAIYNPTDKMSPLHYALQLNSKEIILLMLECKFDLDNFDQAKERSVLHFLCGNNFNTTEKEELINAEIAEICIKKGATVDIRDPQLRTPLYLAVLVRQKHLVKTFLSHGADPNILDHKGWSILENLMRTEISAEEFYGKCIFAKDTMMQIIQKPERDSEIAQMLLAYNAIGENLTNGQVSIYHYYAANLHPDMLLKIISYNINPNISDSRKNTIIHTLLIHNLNSKEEDVEKQVVEIVSILLSKKADMNAVNEKGETLLHLAAKSKHFKVLKALLGQNTNVVDLDNDGNTVLHFLCMLQVETKDSIEQFMTELFISNGCDINARNKNGMTPLSFAAQSGSINMTRIFLNLNAKIDCIENKNLSMSIHLATINNHPEIIEQLVQHGADVNIRRGDRKTALHLAVNHKATNATIVLLNNGADTDLKDSEGKTPLHLACWYESLDNIYELLEYGADVNKENHFHATPIMLIRNSTNVSRLLRYHLVKLVAANMYVSERNKSYIEKNSEYYISYTYASNMREFEEKAIEETLKMEKVVIAPRISLADVLLMSATRLSFVKNNEEFQKVVNSEDFDKKFPIYAHLVNACYRKGIIRSDFMILTKDAFRKIVRSALPDTCCDAIFDYLDNDDLLNLDKAATLMIAKYKRNLEVINYNFSAKRLKRVSD